MLKTACLFRTAAWAEVWVVFLLFSHHFVVSSNSWVGLCGYFLVRTLNSLYETLNC